MSFESLGLSKSLLHAVSKKGYTKPSPIQEKVIPHVLERKDILASAQTGTGKTAGFALPMLQILSEGNQRNRPAVRALILTPTRELAAQVHEDVVAYGEFTHLRSAVIFGGVSAVPQIKALRNGVDVLIATPGRLLDLKDQGIVSLDQVEILVLDEADRMLDMGFQRDINKILDLLPRKRQSLLFSATFSKEIKKLAQGMLNSPISVEATPENTTVEKIQQRVIFADKGQKTNLAIKLISDGDWSQVLIFTRTKHGANKLGKKLTKAGLKAAEIHGNKTQGARTRALAGFKDGSVRVLVATDIAARGLDIPLLPHVINFELPNVAEDYVHRIGRTGRAGASGEAVSFVCADEVEYLNGIEKLIELQIPSGTVEGFEPAQTINRQTRAPKPAKENNRSQSQGGRPKRNFYNKRRRRD
ncbi:MAG: DEAD/DEAH box helicase [Cyclobacteriaceae bacterium]